MLISLWCGYGCAFYWRVGTCLLKGELRNRFNIISEERVKFSEQNSENLMKIGWKIRKLWHFEVSQIFTKHFLTSRYEYANERVDDVIASLFAIYILYINFWKIQYFPQTCDSMFLISRYIGVNIILHLFREELREVERSLSWNMKFLSFLYTKWNGKLWGDDIINSLICIFIATGQELFLEN